MARLSRFLNDSTWVLTQTGGAVVTPSDSGKTMNLAAITNDAAFIINSVVAWPGDSFEFSVLARNIETGKTGFGEVIIDSPPGVRRQEIRIESKSLKPYTLRYDVPVGAEGLRVIDFVLGVDTPTDGSAEYTLPLLFKTKGDNIFLSATYKIASAGGITLLSTVKPFNTNAADLVGSWDGTNIWFLITPTETSASLFANGIKPILQFSASAGNSNSKPITWNIEGLTDSGAFHIQALDELGARIDLNANDALRPDLFVTVTLELR